MSDNKSPRNRLAPQDIFSVSQEVRHLEAAQLREFEAAFTAWKNAARGGKSMQARQRLHMVFLLLRHTGARLGEILSLDDRSAFDHERSMVAIQGRNAIRQVPLPEELNASVSEMLASPMGCALRGEFFHVDPGYLRRTCYARGKECGLPRDLANPRVLRNTRAVEMLRGGVPLAVVKEILGQSSLDLAAGFQQFTSQDVESIVRLAQQDMRKRTSARNSFIGRVERIVTDTVMAEVSLRTRSGVEICAIITTDSLQSMRLAEGSPVAATIKAPLVNIMAGNSETTGSARNRLRATILRVLESPAVAEITGRLEDGTEVCALISGQAARDMALRPGDTAQFWFKALSVVLNTVHL
ncbi:TOBE domain-containing protein [Salidesulfovibrio onnuriiensis]|uniref:TOBE domain-containing protein n=1 Tax=Salidesulfovibrio onnuriiensis TaxID=2583823 RepID=UPI0011CA31CB|nr:TOBE domain-containing protein [Salidesulfovibrio onnuriiensis]